MVKREGKNREYLPVNRPRRRSKQEELMEIYRTLLTAFGPRNWWPARTAEEVIFGAILTQNTGWQNAKLAISALEKAGRLSFRSIAGMSPHELAPLIRSSGFFNQKTEALKRFADFLGERFDFDLAAMGRVEIGDLRQELLGLYRIGKETADSILLYALEKPVFVIDAYTKRIFGRHGFMDSRGSYDDFQEFFMQNLTADVPLYNEFHALIVRTGHLFCKPEPLCRECPLSKVPREEKKDRRRLR